MIYPPQIRAARALLNITQAELSTRSGVGVATIKRVEGSTDTLRVTVDVLLKIQRALETGGVEFLDQDLEHGPGVRLVERVK